MTDEKQKPKEMIEVAEVVTQTDVGYKLPDGKVVSYPEYIVWLGNQILELKKGLL